MRPVVFQYPKTAAFGRVLPKTKIYQHGKPRSFVKEFFVRQVEQIVWQYKLSPETINMKGTILVPEIQIFSITLKEGELKNEVLHCIDQAIPFPIVFELNHKNKLRVIAAYKRLSEADASRWVISSYFDTNWVSADIQRKPLPVVFDLETLYEQLLIPLMPFPVRSGEPLKAWVKRMEEIRSKKQEMQKCEHRLKKEKQFNRRVEINAELRDLRQELSTLTRPNRTPAP